MIFLESYLVLPPGTQIWEPKYNCNSAITNYGGLLASLWFRGLLFASSLGRLTFQHLGTSRILVVSRKFGNRVRDRRDDIRHH